MTDKGRVGNVVLGIGTMLVLVAAFVAIWFVAAVFWSWGIMLVTSTLMDPGPSFWRCYPAGLGVSLFYALTFGRFHYPPKRP